MQKIDFGRLLGFDTINTEEVDFSDDTFGAKLGAKVGVELSPAKSIDFQDDTFGARLGAKISAVEVE